MIAYLRGFSRRRNVFPKLSYQRANVLSGQLARSVQGIVEVLARHKAGNRAADEAILWRAYAHPAVLRSVKQSTADQVHRASLRYGTLIVMRKQQALPGKSGRAQLMNFLLIDRWFRGIISPAKASQPAWPPTQ